ncbi:hypothetical protein Tco_0081591 [Tanacetum coccineum]
MSKFIVVSFIQGFEFQNPSSEQIDMTERPGITNIKATPLELLVAPRSSPHLHEEPTASPLSPLHMHQAAFTFQECTFAK